MMAEEEECVEEEQGTNAAEARSEREEKLKLGKKETDQTTTLYLFGRTGREKEEWYQQLMLASKNSKEESNPGAEPTQTCFCQNQIKPTMICKK